MVDILMPHLGENVTEATITRWTKSVGERVATDEVLFEVSTDKVDSEIPSPTSGVLTEIVIAEGEVVLVGSRVAVVVTDAEKSETTVQDAPKPETPIAPITEPSISDLSSNAPSRDEQTYTRGIAYSPMIRRLIDESKVDAREIVGTGAGGRITRSDVLAAAHSRTSGRRKSGVIEGQNQDHSPVVRQLLATFDLDARGIDGTGAGGRITRSDVLAAAGLPTESARRIDRPESSVNGPEAIYESSTIPVEPHTKSLPSSTSMSDDDEIIPFSNIRRRTAEHMIRSKSTSAHTTVAIEVDYSNVERVRAGWNQEFGSAEGLKLTYLPFATMAATIALKQFPQVNSSVVDETLIIHHRINVGIAVDLNFDGLLVPVVKNADGIRLQALAREISVLSGKTRSRKLSVDDLSDGTFTITNAGPFGTLFTVPVINQPQVAILSTDGVKKRPVAVELPDGSDAIVVHPIGNLAMSWDHRAFDGAYAAAFLKSVKDIIESRAWEAEL